LDGFLQGTAVDLGKDKTMTILTQIFILQLGGEFLVGKSLEAFKQGHAGSVVFSTGAGKAEGGAA
jgi:hypothetical protein